MDVIKEWMAAVEDHRLTAKRLVAHFRPFAAGRHRHMLLLLHSRKLPLILLRSKHPARMIAMRDRAIVDVVPDDASMVADGTYFREVQPP